jgi:dihydrolipoamide dehydrogenase
MSYDLIVIGGGPGGYVAAIKGSQKGLTVALVEKDALGGTCANRGCIPTKVYAHAASLLEEFDKCSEFGISVKISYDIDLLRKKKEAVVSQLTSGIKHLLKKNKVDYIQGKAVFQNEKTILVEGKAYCAENFIIATGSKIMVPPIEGIELGGIMTSDDALNLESIPKSIAIIGSGVVGLEFANIYSSFGSNVTLIDMLPELLPQVDREIMKIYDKILQNKNIRTMLGCKVLAIEKGIQILIEKDGNPDIIQCESILVAAGRTANVNGVESLNLDVTRKGIFVNDKMQTSIKNIYCIGDANGIIQLAHAASYQAEIAIANILGDEKLADFSAVPGCAYTSPEIAWVGINETQAKEQDKEVAIGMFPYSGNGRALTMGCKTGLVKVISDKNNGDLLGMFAIGALASEMINIGAVALSGKMKTKDLADCILGHPTVSECLKEAAEDIFGFAIHK